MERGERIGHNELEAIGHPGVANLFDIVVSQHGRSESRPQERSLAAVTQHGGLCQHWNKGSNTGNSKGKKGAGQKIKLPIMNPINYKDCGRIFNFLFHFMFNL